MSTNAKGLKEKAISLRVPESDRPRIALGAALCGKTMNDWCGAVLVESAEIVKLIDLDEALAERGMPNTGIDEELTKHLAELFKLIRIDKCLSPNGLNRLNKSDTSGLVSDAR